MTPLSYGGPHLRYPEPYAAPCRRCRCPFRRLRRRAVPLSTSDLLAVKNIGEVQPSPDGRTVLFTAGSELMRVSGKGGAPEPLPDVPKGRPRSDGRPASSGSHSSATTRSGRSTSRAASSRAFATTTVRTRSSRRPATCSRGPPTAQGWHSPGPSTRRRRAQDPVVVTRILYKGRTALADNRRTHLYVVSVARRDAARADQRQLPTSTPSTGRATAASSSSFPTPSPTPTPRSITTSSRST